MKNVDEIRTKHAPSAYDKKVLACVGQLHPYVRHRLFLAEDKGILPINMYKSLEIIDDGIAKLYQKGYDVNADVSKIKLILFKLVDERLEVLFEKEAFHQDTVSTDHILNDELERLSEEFTADADSDLILNTELSDISYHQDSDEHVYVFSDRDNYIISSYDTRDLPHKEVQRRVHKIYNWLPMIVSDIVDLNTFGHLSVDEIAEIRDIQPERVEHILELVRKSFRSHLE